MSTVPATDEPISTAGRDQNRATLLAVLVALCLLVYHRHPGHVQHPVGGAAVRS